MNLLPRAAPTDLPAPPEGKVGWPWTSADQAAGAQGSESWPRISIVTPSYNQGRFIEQTLRSVLLQDYPNLEYIVIDGGSEDETASLLQQYGGFLSYCQSKPDGGQADAIQQGFQMASGSILAWINSDDYYEPYAFRRIAGFFARHPDCVFANSDVNLVDEDSRFIRRLYAMRPSFFFAANMGQHGWPQPGCFWRRSAYETAGGINADFQFSMDLDLFTRLVKYGKGCRLPGRPTANFRVHPASKTANLQAVSHRERAAVIAKYGQSFWSSRPAAMNALWWVYRKQAAVRLRRDRLKQKRTW